jgi:hypothetical protein
MSGLKPKKLIDDCLLNVVDALRLPLAVVLQRGKEIKVYKVDENAANGYVEEIDRLCSFRLIEETTTSLGKEISKDEFLGTEIFPFPIVSGGEGKNEYAIYKAYFRDKKSL